MKTINVRKRLIFKLQHFFSCLLIFCFISLIGENQRMFSGYGHTKHWSFLKTASGNPAPFTSILMSAALMYFSLSSSDTLLILSELNDLLEANQLTKNFSKEEMIGIIEGFLMSRALIDADAIEGLNEEQKSKLMTLTIILSSTQSNEKKEIRTVLGSILQDILHEISLTDTLFTEEAVIKTRLIETIELIALNLRKTANQNPFIMNDGLVEEIEIELKSILRQMNDKNQQNQEIIDKVNQTQKILSELQKNQSSSSSHLLPDFDFNVETLFSVFKTSGINKFIEPLNLDKKRISGLTKGFFIFKLFERGGDLMIIHPNKDITLWTEEQKIQLTILSVNLSLLILHSKKENQDILLNELEIILSQIRRLTKNYKEERREVKIQFIEALGLIASNLVKTNSQSSIDDSYTRNILILMSEKFAEDNDPTIRLKVLELIEKVGQTNEKIEQNLDAYELNTLLKRLMEDKDSSVKEKALDVIKTLNLELKVSCFGLFQKFVPKTTN